MTQADSWPERLPEEMELRGPPPTGQLDRLRRELAGRLPADYLELLAAHDGGSSAELVLLPAEEVALADDAHPELDHLHGLVVFATNGAGEAFAFDGQRRVVMVPWIGRTEDALPQGSFLEFLERLRGDRLFD